MTKSRDARKDLVGRLGPDEGLGMAVCDVDIPPNGRLQFAGAAMDTTPQLLVGERREPALDQVDPRGTRRREMHVVPRMAHEPAVNERRLVGAVVVENHMHVERRRDGRLDGVEERAELPGAVPVVELADDLARRNVQGGEERGGAVTGVIVGPPLHLPGPHGQQRLRAIQRLDLGFLVDAQHERLIRRIEVEPHDVPHLVDEQRVLRQLERLHPVRAQAERAPDATRSEEHTSELQSLAYLVCRLLLEKKKLIYLTHPVTTSTVRWRQAAAELRVAWHLSAPNQAASPAPFLVLDPSILSHQFRSSPPAS